LDKIISIITPSFNSSKYIEKTICSVKEQNYLNFEYIVIDGKSSDSTCEIIRKYEDHIIYWESMPDNGQSHAINKGLKKVNGNIINWLNADDYYNENALEIVNSQFDRLDVLCVAGKSRLFDENGTIKYSNGTDIYPGNLAKTIGWARVDQPETFFRKEAWKKIGLLNEQLHYTMDREWWMRYLYIFGLDGIKRINDVLVNFRIHGASKTTSQNEKFQIEHDSLFYLLSLNSSNSIFSKTIEKECTIDKMLQSEISNWNNTELINQVLNYYCLKKADELYYQYEKKKAQSFLACIDHELLDDEGRKLFNKLSFRLKLPSKIIQIFRNK